MEGEMKAYLAYKEWWLSNVFPAESESLYFAFDNERAFEQHVKDLGLYRLMEKLCEWDDE